MITIPIFQEPGLGNTVRVLITGKANYVSIGFKLFKRNESSSHAIVMKTVQLEIRFAAERNTVFH